MYIDITGECTVDCNYKMAVTARLSSGPLLDIVTYENDESITDHSFNYTLRLPKETLLKSKGQWVIVTQLNVNEEIIDVISIETLVKDIPIGIDYDLAFPSIGFFGDAKGGKLHIPVNRELDSFTLHISEKPGILNIGGIEITAEDGSVLKPREDFKIEYSSSIPEGADPYRVFSDRGFHSAKENQPFLSVNFGVTKNVSSIVIRNRSDRWGVRARTLEIKGVVNDTSFTVYKPKNALTSLSRKLISLGWSASKGKLSAEEQRENFLTFLRNNVDIAMILEDASWIPFLHQSLSMWSVGSLSDNQRELELYLLALVFTAQTQKGIGLNLKPFSSILSTRAAINKLENFVNNHRRELKLELIKFTKHGVARKGTLVDDIPVVMKTLNAVITMLEHMNLEPCLAYGTLLGARRDNAFISHDDDVDILVRLPEENISEKRARELRDEIIKALPKEKYRIDYGQQHNLNIHLYCKKTGVMIDIFPYWVSGDKAYLHMETMTIRGIDKEIFNGRQNIQLYGEELPAPNLIEDFLFERYGSGWTISDKFHEWPWKLED